MFLNTFAISNSTVNTALNKLSEGNGVIVAGDKRGRHHPLNSINVDGLSHQDLDWNLLFVSSDMDSLDSVERISIKRKCIQKFKKCSKRAANKLLKNLGQEYLSHDGKIKLKKKLLPGCDEKCRFQCKRNITDSLRKDIFTKYWSLGDRKRQWDFLAKFCERSGTKTRTTKGPSIRNFTIKYFLPNNLDEPDLGNKTKTISLFATLLTFEKRISLTSRIKRQPETTWPSPLELLASVLPLTAWLGFYDDRSDVVILAKSRYTGRNLVMFNDYTYYCKKQNKRNNQYHWYCSTHNWKGCNAKLKLDGNYTFLGIDNAHTHPPARYLIHYLQVQLHESSSKRRMWNQENMVNAIKDLRAGRMGLKKAVQVYSVPKTTLRRFVHSNYTAEEAVKIFEFLPTRKGNYRLKYNDYTFWCRKYEIQSSKSGRWYCSKKKSKNCPVVVQTMGWDVAAVFGEHNHSWISSQREEAISSYTSLAIHTGAIDTILSQGNHAAAVTRGHLGDSWGCVPIAEVIITKRGFKFLLVNGYTYCRNFVSENKIRWRCSNRKCSARVHTVEGKVTVLMENHNHPQKRRSEANPLHGRALELYSPAEIQNTPPKCSVILLWCRMLPQMGAPNQADLQPQYLLSSRGSRMLLIGGNKYRVNRAYGNRVRWRCATHERFSCRARVHTIEDQIVYFMDEHTTYELEYLPTT
ncbi:unnamed protein product [Chilo suppressalis]|uniref:FLYWCH-type domain-containing protein n=1 Tax=Chilo suppressalis TaxID=168631 RepID=A0ABN8AT74_CHISP|nr:unnamed protein product [Chilo suppressalis]